MIMIIMIMTIMIMIIIICIIKKNSFFGLLYSEMNVHDEKGSNWKWKNSVAFCQNKPCARNGD